MASNPEKALKDSVEALGTTPKRYRETLHLPMHHISVGVTPIAFYRDEKDVPNYFADFYSEIRPEWIGSTCKLESYSEVIKDDEKVAYLLKASRLDQDGLVMSTFEGIFTLGRIEQDWRLISRNIFNVSKDSKIKQRELIDKWNKKTQELG
jgi:hypothetical protein